MKMITETETIQTHSQALHENGMYVFMGEVNNENISPIVEWILIDVMRSSVIPIKTVGLGMIASAGLLVFISGTKDRRVLTPNTSILSHQFSWSNEGKAHELFATMREFELTQQRMLNHYRLCTGLSDDEIRQHLLPPNDVWLSATDAMSLNVCDHISALTR